MVEVEQRIDKLFNNIKIVFNSELFGVERVYRGNSIVINGIDNDTYVYIRVCQSKAGFKVEIANINLDLKLQRKGYFTRLVNEIKSLDFVDDIIVSTVLTVEMEQACIKNHFEESEEYLGYSIHLHSKAS